MAAEKERLHWPISHNNIMPQALAEQALRC